MANPVCPRPQFAIAPKRLEKDSSVIIRFGHRYCHPKYENKIATIARRTCNQKKDLDQPWDGTPVDSEGARPPRPRPP